MGGGSIGLWGRGDVTRWAPRNLDVNVSLKALDGPRGWSCFGELPAERAGPGFTWSAFLLSLGSAQGSSTSSEPEMHELSQFLS